MDATTLPPSKMIMKQLHNLPNPTHGFSSKSTSYVLHSTIFRKTSSKPPKLVVSMHATMSSTSIVVKPVNLYDVLQVERNASPMEVKKAYRRLAKIYHPDSSSNQGDSRDFMAIREAYATLSDPTARALYDLSNCTGDPTWQSRFGHFERIGYQHGWRWETDQCW